MTPHRNALAMLAAWATLLAAGSALVGAPARAESSASSASSAGSASIGSLSDSVRGSSKSSSGETKVAEGDYRVIEVAELADRPGLLELRLQAAAEPGEAGALWLTVPRAALAQRPLQPGDVLQARQRPYGVAFAHAQPHQPFFLLLAGTWPRELDPQRVAL